MICLFTAVEPPVHQRLPLELQVLLGPVGYVNPSKVLPLFLWQRQWHTEGVGERPADAWGTDGSDQGNLSAGLQLLLSPTLTPSGWKQQ